MPNRRKAEFVSPGVAMIDLGDAEFMIIRKSGFPKIFQVLDALATRGGHGGFDEYAIDKKHERHLFDFEDMLADFAPHKSEVLMDHAFRQVQIESLPLIGYDELYEMMLDFCED